MNKQIYVLNVSTYFTLFLYLLSIRIRYMLWQYSTNILAQRQQLLYVIIIIIIIKGIYKRIEQGGSKLGSPGGYKGVTSESVENV